MKPHGSGIPPNHKMKHGTWDPEFMEKLRGGFNSFYIGPFPLKTPIFCTKSSPVAQVIAQACDVWRFLLTLSLSHHLILLMISRNPAMQVAFP